MTPDINTIQKKEDEPKNEEDLKSKVNLKIRGKVHIVEIHEALDMDISIFAVILLQTPLKGEQL